MARNTIERAKALNAVIHIRRYSNVYQGINWRVFVKFPNGYCSIPHILFELVTHEELINVLVHAMDEFYESVELTAV